MNRHFDDNVIQIHKLIDKCGSLVLLLIVQQALANDTHQRLHRLLFDISEATRSYQPWLLLCV